MKVVKKITAEVPLSEIRMAVETYVRRCWVSRGVVPDDFAGPIHVFPSSWNEDADPRKVTWSVEAVTEATEA